MVGAVGGSAGGQPAAAGPGPAARRVAPARPRGPVAAARPRARPGAAPPVPPDTPRYRFEAFLARGGMAEVWRGCDTVLAREVALKVLREPVFGDGGARARFEEEARHVSQLEHPSIVP